jgi:hypothetical protein
MRNFKSKEGPEPRPAEGPGFSSPRPTPPEKSVSSAKSWMCRGSIPWPQWGGLLVARVGPAMLSAIRSLSGEKRTANDDRGGPLLCRLITGASGITLNQIRE